MGSVNLDNTGSGSAITLSSDGTSLLLDGTAVGGGADLYAANPVSATNPTAQGDNSISIGSGASDGSSGYDNAIAIGTSALAEAARSVSIGKSTNSGTDGVGIGTNAHGGGSTATAVGAHTDARSVYATAIGAWAQAWTGWGATAIAKSYASGTDSFAAVITNNTSSYGATGANSIAIGYQNKADDPNAVAIGKSNISSGSQTSIAIGQSNNVTGMRGVAIGDDNTVSGLIGHAYGAANTVSGQYAVAFNGSNDAASNYSFVSGYYADSHGVKGRLARGTAGLSLNGTKGDAQYGLLVLSKNTTNATQTALSTDTLTAGSDNQLVVQNNGAVAFHGTIVAKQASSSNVAAWEVKGLMHNVTTATLVNSAITVINNAPGWGLAISADTTNDAVQFLVTGAAVNISWVATIHSSEVIRS
tara:strand:- start:262 stop:1512 length:1251 start_codon:yes stop_codon:yes gene_type:complete